MSKSHPFATVCCCNISRCHGASVVVVVVVVVFDDHNADELLTFSAIDDGLANGLAFRQSILCDCMFAALT